MAEAGKSRGGKARAAALAPEERQEIARRAALARWEGNLPEASFGSPDRPLRIGDLEISCFVLSDGRRVLTQGGMFRALGMSSGSGHRDGDRLASFVSGRSISPFISEKLRLAITSPIKFRVPAGGAYANGYEAEILAEICEAVLRARESGSLQKQQEHIALRCEMLVRAFARVGIIALVDEATGYQEIRDRYALQKYLEMFVRKELAAWAKRFPDEFYEQIFRLRGWQHGVVKNGPRCVAKYTNDLVYKRLAPNILEELERKNPIEGGRRKVKHHQWLSDDIGHPALAQHLHAVIMFMRASTNWQGFLRLMDTAMPKKGDNLQFAFMGEALEMAVRSGA